MKRIIAILLLLSVLLSGCGKADATTPTTTAPIEDGNIVISQSESEIILRNTDNWMTEGLKKVGLEDFTQIQVEEGNLQTSSGSEKYRGFILASFYNTVARKSYLAVELKDEVIIRPFVEGVEATYADIIYLRDIDGDKTDDIIMQSTVDSMGGAGQYASQVYRVTENGIEQVFCVPFDTGFRGSISSDYKMTVYHEGIGYQKEFDYLYTYELSENAFDDGNDIIDDVLNQDSFMSFVPVDYDNDGVYEIEGVQYTWTFWHSCYVGNVKAVLKYDSTTNSFVVIDGSFDEYLEYSDLKLPEIVEFKGSVEELDQLYPIKFIRENNGILEIFYPSIKRVAIVYCESDEVIYGKLHTTDTYKYDFENLNFGDSIDIVKEISPDGDYSFMYTGRDDLPKISYHYTKDGYEVAVSYDENLKITEIVFDLIY